MPSEHPADGWSAGSVQDGSATAMAVRSKPSVLCRALVHTTPNCISCPSLVFWYGKAITPALSLIPPFVVTPCTRDGCRCTEHQRLLISTCRGRSSFRNAAQNLLIEAKDARFNSSTVVWVFPVSPSSWLAATLPAIVDRHARTRSWS